MHALRQASRVGARWTPSLSQRRAPRGPLQSIRRSSQQRQPKKPFVILSMDGGGCRGYMSIRLLERVCEEAPGFLDRVDLFAGTSTGSILAAFLASGASPGEAASYYEDYVPAIFGRPRNLVRRAWDAKFSNRPLKDALRTYFGDATVAQLPKHFLAPALRVDGEASSTTSAEVWRLSQSREGGWRPAVFSNLPAVRGARPDVELKISDALLRSSAAPTILPLYQNYGDGGIWANNPTMLAVAKAKLHLGLDPSDVRVLSVGAGSWARRVVEPTASEKDLDLGLADWAPHLLEMVIDASGMTTDMEASFLLRENYTRLSPLIPQGVSLALDDPSTLQRQLEYAKHTDIEKAVEFAQRIVAEPASILELPDEPLGDSVHDLKEVDRLKLVDRAWADAAAKWQQEKSTDDFGSRKRRSLENWRRTREG